MRHTSQQAAEVRRHLGQICQFLSRFVRLRLQTCLRVPELKNKAQALLSLSIGSSYSNAGTYLLQVLSTCANAIEARASPSDNIATVVNSYSLQNQVDSRPITL